MGVLILGVNTLYRVLCFFKLFLDMVGKRLIKPSHLICRKNPDYYVHVETGSKNRSGRLKELNVDIIRSCPCI